MTETTGGKTMKKSEMYKKTIIDVICASGGEITDDRFEQLVMLIDAYKEEERAAEREATMDTTKCLYNPVRECEYAECDGCDYYERIKHPEPDPDELYELERDDML